jgi:hypothetical protein
MDVTNKGHAGFRVHLWVTALATAVGFIAYGILKAVPWVRSAELLALLLVALALAFAFGRALRIPFAAAVAGTWALGLACFAGFGPTAATLLLLAASIALGSFFVRARTTTGLLVAIVAGLAMLTAILGWLLPFPVHFRGTYVLLLAGLVALRFRHVAEAMRRLPRDFAAATARAPIASTLSICIIGLASTAAWVPTVQFDDLAYHLALPTELQAYGYYRMDVIGSVWALAPWASDLLHGVVQVLAGGEGRGAVTAAWLVIACTAAWQLTRRLGVPHAMRWWTSAALAATPLMGGQLSGMQTELPTLAAVLVLVLLVRAGPTQGRKLVAIATLAGFILALKVSNAYLLIALGTWTLCRMRAWPSPATLTMAIAAALFVAAPSYAYSMLIAHNPVLPLYNATFLSPYYEPLDFVDIRWLFGLDWGTVWSMLFDSGRYGELLPGGAGMLLLFALVGSLVALRERRTRSIALVALFATLALLAHLQYLRYTIPSAALMTIVAIAAFSRLRFREVPWVVGALVLMNVALLPLGSYQLRAGLLKDTVLLGPEGAAEKFSPVRRLVRYLRETGYVGETVWVDGAYGALFGGRLQVSSWYNPSLNRLVGDAQFDESAEYWTHLLQDLRIGTIIVDTSRRSVGLAHALEGQGAFRERVLDSIEVWRLPSVAGLALIEPPQRSGPITLKFHSRGVRMVDTLLTFECDKPGARISVGWFGRMPDGKGKRMDDARAVCGQDGRAVVQRLTRIEEGARELHVSVTVPATKLAWKGDSPMTLQLASFSVQAIGPTASPRDKAAQLRHDLAGHLGLDE